MKSKIKLNGNVTVTVRTGDGDIKTYRKSVWRQIFGMPAKKMISKHHNTITDQGDALIADLLAGVPVQTKVDGTNGYIQLGTGWTGSSAKLNAKCNAPITGTRKLDEGYPKLKGAFGESNDTVVQYKVSFPAGSLNSNDIDEACLLNGSTSSAKSLAYAQVKPAVSITSTDTLIIEWEITILGS